MEVTFENVKQVIVEADVSSDVQTLEADTAFEVIGLDSLDHYNVLLAVEEAFGVTMSEDQAESLDTIAKLVTAVQNLK